MNEREDLNMAVVDAYDEYLQATEKRSVSYGELAYIEGLSDKQARDMLEECYQELNKIEKNKMNYDEQQGVAYAVGKLYDLLDEHASNEKIAKDAIRDLIKELEYEYNN